MNEFFFVSQTFLFLFCNRDLKSVGVHDSKKVHSITPPSELLAFMDVISGLPRYQEEGEIQVD